MNKSLFSFITLLSLSTSILSLNAVGPDDDLDWDEGGFCTLIKTKDIEQTEHYKELKLPAVPVLHAYNALPSSRFVIGGSHFPRTCIDERLAEKMMRAGVKPSDPFYIVIQESDEDLILRPMYYFEDNKKIERKATSYSDTMILKAQVHDRKGVLSLNPDLSPDQKPLKHFTVSSHNSLSLDPQADKLENILSSGANMSLNGLGDHSNSFFAFYKGLSQTVDEIDYRRGADNQPLINHAGQHEYNPATKVTRIVKNEKGVSVLHVVLNGADWDTFFKNMKRKRKVGDILKAFDKLNKNPIISLVQKALVGMFDEADKPPVELPGRLPITLMQPANIGLADLKPQAQSANKAQSITRDQNGITVLTDHNNAASYQLQTDPIPVEGDSELRIHYRVTVQPGGRIALGLLNTQQNGWFGPEVIFEPGVHEGIFERDIPSADTLTRLVVRNYHLGNPGQSHFTIHNMRIEKEAVTLKALKPQFQSAHMAQSIALDLNGLHILTNTNKEANYQVQSDPIQVIPETKIRIQYNIHVENGGRISMGLLNTQQNGWYGDELILGPGDYNDVYERIVPLGEALTRLVFRNYHLGEPGQSKFTIKSIKFEM